MAAPGPHHPRARPGFRLPPISARVLLPNLVTLLALCAGLTAIRLGIEGRIESALVAVVIAGILDGMDGRLARLLKGTTHFGAELDSLADFVNFGVTPAVILYITYLSAFGSLGWIASLVFSIALALRLARFNVEAGDDTKPSWTARFSSGIPAPAAAGCALLPLYIEFSGVGRGTIPVTAVLIYVVLIALLAASRWPTFSGKQLGFKIRREHAALWVIGCVAFVSLVVAYTFPMLAGLSLLYLASLPFSRQAHARLNRAEATPRP